MRIPLEIRWKILNHLCATLPKDTFEALRVLKYQVVDTRDIFRIYQGLLLENNVTLAKIFHDHPEIGSNEIIRVFRKLCSSGRYVTPALRFLCGCCSSFERLAQGALASAIRVRNADTVEFLCEHFDFRMLLHFDKDSMLLKASKTNVRVFKALLRGFDVSEHSIRHLYRRPDSPEVAQAVIGYLGSLAGGYVDTAFFNCCRYNKRSCVEYFLHLGVSEASAISGFISACVETHYKLADLIRAQTNIGNQGIRGVLTCSRYPSTIDYCVRLVGADKIYKIMRGDKFNAFRNACRTGNLVKAQKLFGIGMTVEDTCLNNHKAFRSACSYGRWYYDAERRDLIEYLEALGATRGLDFEQMSYNEYHRNYYIYRNIYEHQELESLRGINMGKPKKERILCTDS